MKLCRCLGALLAVSVFSWAGATASAWGPRGPAVVPSPYANYPDGWLGPGYMSTYGFPYNTPYGYPYVMPYLAPYPAYGILPPPFATMQRLYGPDLGYGRRTAGDYVPADTLPYEPRKRLTEYPAVPFGRSPEDQQADLTRARFEITVPTADAVVLFDGVTMTKTGLRRVYVTPPLVEGKTYSATIEVNWKAEDGATERRKKSFDFVAGQKVSHTFGE